MRRRAGRGRGRDGAEREPFLGRPAELSIGLAGQVRSQTNVQVKTKDKTKDHASRAIVLVPSSHRAATSAKRLLMSSLQMIVCDFPTEIIILCEWICSSATGIVDGWLTPFQQSRLN